MKKFLNILSSKSIFYGSPTDAFVLMKKPPLLGILCSRLPGFSCEPYTSSKKTENADRKLKNSEKLANAAKLQSIRYFISSPSINKSFENQNYLF